MSLPIFSGRAALMTSGSVEVRAVVSPTFTYALDQVMNELRLRQPKASDAERLDMIFSRGLIGCVDDYGLPRVGSNPDEDS